MADATAPPASKTLTPAQYGAVAPEGVVWPLNHDAQWMYHINRIYGTVQGEGGMVGTPMVIVRLQGCPVGCVFCDTPESWEVNSKRLSALQVTDQVKAFGLHWALVTGGEPTWHDLNELTRALSRRGVNVALETAGVYTITGAWDWVTVSPKPAGKLPFLPSTLREASELKWIVGKASDVTALDEFIGRHGLPRRSPNRISIQPMSTSAKATQVCLAALATHPHWRLSLQTHKYMEIA